LENIYVYIAPRLSRDGIKYEANTNPWMTTKILDYYLTKIVRKMGAKNLKMLLLSMCCSSENTAFFGNIKILLLPGKYTTQLQP
jgi:hypothetical protein